MALNPFSKTDTSVKHELYNAVVSQLCDTKPQDFSKEAMLSVLKKNYNNYIVGKLSHASTFNKVIDELYDFVANGTDEQLIKNRKNRSYMEGIRTWRDAEITDINDVEEVVIVKTELSDVARMPDYKFNQQIEELSSLQMFTYMNDLSDNEEDIKAQREAVAAAAAEEQKAAELHRKKAEELKNKQIALKAKEEKIKSRKDAIKEAVLEKGKKRAQEEHDEVPKGIDPPSSKKSKTNFTAYFATLDASQKTELCEAGVCDKNGVFIVKQPLNKKTRDEFKISQLNKLVEMNAIVKNY